MVVHVTVADRDGNPVTDLTAGDFKLFDDGKPQAIQTFALESYEPAQPADGTLAGAARDVSPNAGRPRMISLVIDDLTAASRDLYPPMIEALTRFVERDLGPLDQVAILSGSGSLQFPFSDDRRLLLERAASIMGRLNAGALAGSDCPELTDLQARRIGDPGLQNESAQEQDPAFRAALQETMDCLDLDPSDQNSPAVARIHLRAAASRQYQESEFRALSLMETLRQHIRSLRHVDATKSVILFSDGFLSEGSSPIAYKLQDVVDLALRSGVVLHCLDIRGLYSGMPPAAERFPSGGGAVSQKLSLYHEDRRAQEDPLAQLAHETGGLFFRDSNDLYRGLQDAVRRRSAYYVLTYAMPPQKADGSFRRIKLQVGRPGLELSYRSGYYAPREEVTFERRKREDVLEALKAPADLNEIPLRLSYNYYQEDESICAVSFLTDIGVRGVPFLEEGARRKNLISIVVVALDENGRYVEGLEKSVEFRLLEASYAGLLQHGIRSRAEMKLPFGRYKIKAVVRESVQGKMGSTTRVIEIP
jgi:VWFA-related protein